MTDGSAATREWRVTGMDRGSCSAKVRGAVERLPGVEDVDVAPMAERLRLTLDEAQPGRAARVRSSAGLRPRPRAPLRSTQP